MKIGIGNDHAAVELKNIISEHLKERGCEVVNYGTDTSESFDYHRRLQGGQGRGQR